MTATIHHLPVTRCGYCKRKVIKQLASNEPAYCDYTCGVNGQPEHAAATSQSTDGRSQG